jgi:tight adherence protein C
VLPLITLLAVAAVSLSVPLLGYAMVARPDRLQRGVRANLRRRLQHARADGETGAEGTDSLLYAVAARLTTAAAVRRLRRLQAAAGFPAAWPLARLITAKLVLPVALALVAALYLRSATSPLTVLVAVVLVVTARFLPELLLHSRGQKRSQRIMLELADTLDQMTIAVAAGLGFDAAMARAGQTGRGPLAEELRRTLQDMQVGHSRRHAYEDLSRRNDVPDLRRFVRAVIQADAHGVAVVDVLRTQAAEMRMKRRQRAEEKAMQIPVKVVFPLMLCILPCLFIVLLGPAAIDIIQALS